MKEYQEKVAQLKEPVIINGTLSNDPRFKDLEPKEGINSSLILPLIANTELVGVLNATRTNITENFRQTDLRNG